MGCERRLVHADALRRVDDTDAKTTASGRLQLGPQQIGGTGEDDFEASASGGLNGARDHRGWRVIAAHRVDGDDGIRHARESQSSATALA